MWNVEGLRGVIDLQEERAVFEYDTLFLTETFVTDTSRIHLPRHEVFHGLALKGPKGRPKQGVAIAVQPGQNAQLLFSSGSVIVVEVEGAYLACMYSPPDEPIEQVIGTIGEVLLLCRDEEKGICLAGDLNCNLLTDTSRRAAFLEALEDLGLAIRSPTESPTYVCWNGESCIDIVMTRQTDSGIIGGCEIIPYKDRKHQIVYFEMEGPMNRSIGAHAKGNKIMDIPKLQSLLLRPAPGNSANDIEEILRTSIQSASGTGSLSKRHRPWFDSECKEAKAYSRQVAYMFYAGTCDRDTYLTTKRNYRDLKNKKKRKYEVETRIELIRRGVQKPWLLLPRRPPASEPADQ